VLIQLSKCIANWSYKQDKITLKNSCFEFEIWCLNIGPQQKILLYTYKQYKLFVLLEYIS